MENLPKNFSQIIPIRCDEIVRQIPFAKKHLGCGIEKHHSSAAKMKRDQEVVTYEPASATRRSATFKRDASHGLPTYLIEATDPLDRAPLSRDAINFWRTNAPTRKPICIGCKAPFTGEAQVDVAAFCWLLRPCHPAPRACRGFASTCWNGLSDDELERAALRVLRTFLPNAKFEDAP